MKRNPEKSIKIQRYAEKCTEMHRNAQNGREMQRTIEKCRDMQGYHHDLHDLHDLYDLHGTWNIIFDILEPPAFRKYGTCWGVAQKPFVISFLQI